MVGSSRVFGDRAPNGQKKLGGGGGVGGATPKTASPSLLPTACFRSPAQNLVDPLAVCSLIHPLLC